jgi:carbonic anhydrase/acetyltransferase-like protein (isoleucine patch superfamily)
LWNAIAAHKVPKILDYSTERKTMILTFENKTPKIDASVYVQNSAYVVGEVEIGEDSSIWFQTVIRGDVNPIVIGKRTNIQDLCMVHVSRDKFATYIGDDVTVGHRAIVHACTIKDRCLIGMGSTILDGSVIETGCIVAAQSLVPPGFKCKPNSMIMGSPARVTRELREEEVQLIEETAKSYVEYSRRYQKAHL